MAELITVPVPVRISASAFKSQEEFVVDRLANRIISLSAKIVLMILDPERRPPMPKINRKDVIGFLDFLDTSSEREIETIEHSLKYFR